MSESLQPLIKIDQAYQEIRAELGYNVILFGGAIRDTIFGGPVKDWDVIVTSSDIGTAVPSYVRLLQSAYEWTPPSFNLEKQVTTNHNRRRYNIYYEDSSRRTFKFVDLGTYKMRGLPVNIIYSTQNYGMSYGEYPKVDWRSSSGCYDGKDFAGLGYLTKLARTGILRITDTANVHDRVKTLARGNAVCSKYGWSMIPSEVTWLQMDDSVNQFEAILPTLE